MHGARSVAPALGGCKIRLPPAWSDIPTRKNQGLDIENLMMRGLFMPAGVPKESVDYYVDLFNKVHATPEWQQLMTDGAFNQTFMTGDDYARWSTTRRSAIAP